SGGYWPKIPLSTTGMAWAALSNASHIRSGFHAGDRRAERARISHRPAAAIDEGQEIAEDSIEFVRRFEIDRMATVRHHRERSGGKIPLQKNGGHQARPVFIACQNERRNCQPFHVLDEIIERWAFALHAELRVRRTQR